MKKLFILLLFCRVASPVTHSLSFYFTGSSGVPKLPEFVGVVMLDGVEVIYCNSNISRAEPKQDWMRKLLEDDPGHMDWYTDECRASHSVFNTTIQSLMQRFNQAGGVHTYQRMFGCKWDNETEEIYGFNQYGYDGEDFIAFDLKTRTWIAPVQQAMITKHRWDNDKAGIADLMSYLTQRCPDRLKKFVDYGRSSLLRTDLPSVSLLQKSLSSPVSCHATGFYPDRAVMFWRKDGEELHEDVDPGEILPNNDGSFQMSVDLKLSSDKPEDWRRYDCVFQLSGVKDDIITRLDKAVIRTNQVTHSLSFYFTGSSGVPKLPEFVGVVMVDGVEVIYCDSNISRAEPKQDWMRKLLEDDPGHMDWYTDECRASHSVFNTTVQSLMQRFNQAGDVHVFQRMYGCEWDEEVYTFDKYGYDGEDFMEFEPKTQTFIPLSHPQAPKTKPEWDRDRDRIKNITHLLDKSCAEQLKKYLSYWNHTWLRKVLPSVSLLHKSSSSPVSCHATGFYPDRAEMFWRKDGKKLHEDVDPGEILPNNDGSFQMSVDLKLQSVRSKDWGKYECVFHLSGVKDNVTRLDKAVIRTNWELPSVSLLQKSSSSPVSCHATGFYPDLAEMFWRKDGEELHEDVDPGEILPNNDGSFQMSVDLNVSLVDPEDWRRYDCVFQLSGMKDDIVTILDKAAIRTNQEFPVGPVLRGVGVLLLLTVCIAGFFMWRRNKNGLQLSNSDRSSVMRGQGSCGVTMKDERVTFM